MREGEQEWYKYLSFPSPSLPTLTPLPPSPDLNETISKGSLLPTGQGSREGPGQDSICHRALCESLNPSNPPQNNNPHKCPWQQLHQIKASAQKLGTQSLLEGAGAVMAVTVTDPNSLVSKSCKVQPAKTVFFYFFHAVSQKQQLCGEGHQLYSWSQGHRWRVVQLQGPPHGCDGSPLAVLSASCLTLSILHKHSSADGPLLLKNLQRLSKTNWMKSEVSCGIQGPRYSGSLNHLHSYPRFQQTWKPILS